MSNSQGVADQQVFNARNQDSSPKPTSDNAHASSANDIVAQNQDSVNPQYSFGGNLTDADIDQLLVENGIITAEQANAERSKGLSARVTPPSTGLPGSASQQNQGSRQRQFGSQTA